MMLNAWRRRGWGTEQLALLVILPLLTMLVNHQAWTDIVRIASGDEEASHILLVPIVAGWLFWVRRGRMRLVTMRGQYVGPLLVMIAWAMSYLGYHHSMQSVWHAGAVLCVVGAIISVLGVDVLLRFFPVFLVLVFIIPVPGMLRLTIAGPLQTTTAEVTRAIIEMVGLPVTRSGNMLTVNGEPVTVAEACNGMRMIFALVLVCYAFAFGTPLRNYVRVIVILASPVVAVFSNVLRMVPTASLFGYADHDVAMTFHDVAGWVMLGVALLTLIGFVRLLRWMMLPISRYPLAYEYR